jgi:hypothetical protein
MAQRLCPLAKVDHRGPPLRSQLEDMKAAMAR